MHHMSINQYLQIFHGEVSDFASNEFNMKYKVSFNFSDKSNKLRLGN